MLTSHSRLFTHEQCAIQTTKQNKTSREAKKNHIKNDLMERKKKQNTPRQR